MSKILELREKRGKGVGNGEGFSGCQAWCGWPVGRRGCGDL